MKSDRKTEEQIFATAIKFEKGGYIMNDNLTLTNIVKVKLFSSVALGLLLVAPLAFNDGSAMADFTFGTPVNLGPTVNSSSNEAAPCISADGLSLFFHSDRPQGFGDRDLYETTRATTDDEWGMPMNLGPVINSSARDGGASISSDDLLLFFISNRPNRSGTSDIWLTRRITPNDPWDIPINVGPVVNTSAEDAAPSISFDGSTIYFTSNRPGGLGDFDLWQTPIMPIIDLNDDGIVNSADMVIMVDNWGTDNSLCDIGPMPWGDGVVDVQDLIVLAEHLFEEISPAEPVE